MKVDLLSKGYSAKRKRLSLSPLSRSPLMKELTRLGYPDSMPDFLPKDSRRRRATEKVCVLFSQNLDTSKLKQQKKVLSATQSTVNCIYNLVLLLLWVPYSLIYSLIQIVTRLGFSIASCSSDATHFVADRFVRTRNMLEATSLGKHVVTHLRLESCEQAGYNVDEKSYILRDEKKEKEFGFNMHVTLMRGSKHPLLKVMHQLHFERSIKVKMCALWIFFHWFTRPQSLDHPKCETWSRCYKQLGQGSSGRGKGCHCKIR